MKKISSLLLIGMLFLLTACGGSDYSSADVTPPSTWASYTCGSLSFRFMAGWTIADWDGLRSELSIAAESLGSSNHLTLLAHYASPTQAQGTTDYLTLGYYSMRSETTAEDLEEIMEEINTLADALSFDDTDTNMLQNARIRTYSDTPALTFATQTTQGSVTYVAQIALIPQGQRLYLIIYSDFSTKADDSVLEQLLTSLQIS